MTTTVDGCGSGDEPASCYQKVAGSGLLVCMLKCPWARCSWCAGWQNVWITVSHYGLKRLINVNIKIYLMWHKSFVTDTLHIISREKATPCGQTVNYRNKLLRSLTADSQFIFLCCSCYSECYFRANLSLFSGADLFKTKIFVWKDLHAGRTAVKTKSVCFSCDLMIESFQASKSSQTPPPPPVYLCFHGNDQ